MGRGAAAQQRALDRSRELHGRCQQHDDVGHAQRRLGPDRAFLPSGADDLLPDRRQLGSGPGRQFPLHPARRRLQVRCRRPPGNDDHLRRPRRPELPVRLYQFALSAAHLRDQRHRSGATSSSPRSATGRTTSPTLSRRCSCAPRRTSSYQREAGPRRRLPALSFPWRPASCATPPSAAMAAATWCSARSPARPPPCSGRPRSTASRSPRRLPRPSTWGRPASRRATPTTGWSPISPRPPPSPASTTGRCRSTSATTARSSKGSGPPMASSTPTATIGNMRYAFNAGARWVHTDQSSTGINSNVVVTVDRQL